MTIVTNSSNSTNKLHYAAAVRNIKLAPISTEEIVPEDYFIVEEGEIISTDGVIVRANDLSVNESILTGESLLSK